MDAMVDDEPIAYQNFTCINRLLSNLLKQKPNKNWQYDWQTGKLYNWLVFCNFFSQTMNQKHNVNSLVPDPTNGGGNINKFLDFDLDASGVNSHSNANVFGTGSVSKKSSSSSSSYSSSSSMPRKRHRRDAISHLFLNGGLATVPMESLDVFNANYFEDIKLGHCLMASEQRTNVYRWFCDLDIKHPKNVVMNLDTLSPYLRVMSKCLQSFYGYLVGTESTNQTILSDATKEILSVTFRLIICQTKSRLLDDQQTCKTGFHIYAPNLYINDEIAKMFRKTILYRFSKEFSEVDNARLFMEPWYKIFDEAVYNSNGLRMVGSCKVVECRYCPKQPTTTPTTTEQQALLFCKKCFNHRKLFDGNSIYVPVAVLDGLDASKRDDISEREIDRNLEYLIRETSIRTSRTEPEPPFVQPEESDQFPMVEIERLSDQHHRLAKQYSGKSSNHSQSTSGKKSAQTEHDWITLFPTDVEFQRIQQIIRSLPQYNQLTLQHVFREEFKPRNASVGQPPLQVVYTVHVFGPASQRRFCQNINRPHNNVNIWFKLSNRLVSVNSSGTKNYQAGLVQRCFCTCQHTDTTSGLRCSQYASPLIPTSDEDNEILYGHLIHRYSEVVDKILCKFETSNLKFNIDDSSTDTNGNDQDSNSTCNSSSSLAPRGFQKNNNNNGAISSPDIKKEAIDSIMRYSSYAIDLLKPVTTQEIQSINITRQNAISARMDRKRKNERKKNTLPNSDTVTNPSPLKKTKRSNN